MLYFGYGSNLCARDWLGWCARSEHDGSGLRFQRRAWLPGHQLAFDYDSAARGGGALDVVERFGQAAPGALFEVDDAAKAALDVKEGAPHVYEEKAVTVLDEHGGAHEAITYVVTETRRSEHVEPAPGYAELVAEGSEEYGVNTRMLKAVRRGKTPAWEIPSVFVYGSLRTGEYNHGWLQREGGIELKGIGTTPGVLYDCGSWPAMVTSEGSERVTGELWRCASPDATLKTLDELEGFEGWRQEGSLFLRGLCMARMSCGGEVLAWTYRYAGDSCAGELLPAGDWASR